MSRDVPWMLLTMLLGVAAIGFGAYIAWGYAHILDRINRLEGAVDEQADCHRPEKRGKHVGTAEAAAILGVSEFTVRRRAKDLGGEKREGRWQYPLALVQLASVKGWAA